MNIRNLAVVAIAIGTVVSVRAADSPVTALKSISQPKVTPEEAKKLNAESQAKGKGAVGALAAPQDAYPDPPAVGKTDRKTYVALRGNRGNTVTIPEADIIKYCSDKSGCTVRIGMHNWDDTGRVASREFLFFYNKNTGVWRSSLDTAGTKGNNVIEHVVNAWSCYFTDGNYSNWAGVGDTGKDFGLLSWSEYNADCFLTLII